MHPKPIDDDRKGPLQPGLDPDKTGRPHESDPRTDVKPGHKTKEDDPDYRPGDRIVFGS